MKKKPKTTLKLWEKSFLLTFCVFFILLNIAFGIWSVYQFKSALTREMEFCRAEAQQLTARISAVNEKAPSELEMERLLHFYSGRQTYLKIIFDGEQWMNSFPDDAILAEHNGTVRVGNDTFYYYDSLLDAGTRDQNAELCYAKNLAGFYGKQYKILAGTAAAMLLISAIVGALLYQAMKRIYRPVSNISHELKTPLTSVMGYAQYLSQTSRLSEADRKFAQQQILQEAYYMKDIVDRVLTLDSIKNTGIHREVISMEPLLEELCQLDDGISIESSLDTLECDPVLMKSMLLNLVNNGLRESKSVQITASAEGITISNEAPALTARDVRHLNQGELLSREKIKNSGYGIPLCHEIAKLHGWKLEYTLQHHNLTAHIHFAGK
ncbi:MAG: HAMP domain-containing sensor histidine kinase [Clostridia bacterium]|nr:HAMP domain-containing sensor histidine kinase [Clostridia bacterium]